MTEPTKINKWLVGITLGLLLIASGQSYLLFQKTNNRLTSSQPSLLDETNITSDISTLRNWDPFSEIQNIQKNMDRLFAQGANSQFPSISNFDFGKISSHQLNIKDEGNNYLITLEVQGLKETDLKVSVQDQTLNISGSIEKTVENKDNNSFSRQFSSQHFQQAVTLPGPVKPETVTVTYKGDSLKIQIEKT